MPSACSGCLLCNHQRHGNSKRTKIREQVRQYTNRPDHYNQCHEVGVKSGQRGVAATGAAEIDGSDLQVYEDANQSGQKDSGQYDIDAGFVLLQMIVGASNILKMKYFVRTHVFFSRTNW